MSIALLCSGQGQQSRDMLALLSGCEPAQRLLTRASRLLGEDMATFLAQASDERLYENRAGQILCVSYALATYAALFPDGAPPDSYVAGYSVGEMAAWGVAGIWSFDQTLDLVDCRARLMDDASRRDDGLCYIRGLSQKKVVSLALHFDCAVAIVNPDRLFILGGEQGALSQLCASALAQGAARAGLLPVHVASHTARLVPAVAPIRQAFAAQPAAKPTLRLLTVTDQNIVRDPEKALSGLARQVAQCIDWEATLHALKEREVERILELGPGSALAEMARTVMPDMAVRSVTDFRSITGIRNWIGA